ncbi:RlpA-like double-psi beta-barrel-protein domain-containing protein-containing protein [Syncephalis fuscata]|nr:RlpA-like double-psi beta-barrel-protein domain-containing protein-containing protein [Syncephalis fuscata]
MRITFSALFLFSLAVIVSAKRHYPRAFQVNHFERRGIITYYTPSNDACSGVSSSKNDMVAALGESDFGSDKNTEDSSVCGRCAKVTGPLGSVVVKIVDKCESCNSGHIDLSPAAFAKVAKKKDGKLAAKWSFVDCPASLGDNMNTSTKKSSKKSGKSKGKSSKNKNDSEDSNSKNKDESKGKSGKNTDDSEDTSSKDEE